MTAKRDPACMGGDRAGVPGRLDKSRQQDALSLSTLQSSTLIFSTFALLHLVQANATLLCAALLCSN